MMNRMNRWSGVTPRTGVRNISISNLLSNGKKNPKGKINLLKCSTKNR